jgi:FKBP-type peptidyl-prolyl cis-trans isomerase
MHETLIELKRKVVAQQAREWAEAQQKNLQAGEAFLAENAKQDRVVVLASGLQYRVLEPGSGKQPAATDTVTVHYRGTLIDGTEFDSSYSRNKPDLLRGPGDPGLARGTAADAGRCKMGAIHPGEARLR